MSNYYQLNLLQTDDVSIVEAKVDRHYARLENLRKGTFARLNELQRKNDELERRLNLLEKHICNGHSCITSGKESYHDRGQDYELDCQLSIVGE